MPLTVPNIIRSYARGGGSIVFTLDIEPSAVDTWTTKRFATAKVEIAGDAYDEATLGGLAKIGFEAKVIQGGNVAVLPNVDVRLLNKAKLHEQFITDIIEGRRAVVKMTAVGPNICLNSSFEKHVSHNFESWTEVPGAGGGLVEALGSPVYEGYTACKLTGGTGAGSYIASDPMVWRVGSKVILSCYARTSAGTATLKAAVHVGTNLWYNATGKTFGMSRVKNTLGVANSTAWQQFYLEMDWNDFYTANVGVGTTLLVDQAFYVELWSEISQGVIVDAVQVELNNQITPYNHNRYELIAADAVTVFSGIVKNPEWSADEISISLEAWNSNCHRDIPKTILTDATDATWKVPKDSMGKPFPMTYGDFNADELTVWDPNNPLLTEFARGLLANINPSATGGLLVYFDRPGMILYKPGGAILRLYHFCEDDNRYYEQMYNDAAGYGYSTREFIEDFTMHPRWKANTNCYWMPLARIPFMATLKSNAVHFIGPNWGAPEHACDGLIATSALKYSLYMDTAVKYMLEAFPFDADSIIRASDSDVEIYLMGDFAGEGGGSNHVGASVLVQAMESFVPGCSDLTLWAYQACPISWRNTHLLRGGGDPALDKLLTQLKLSITSWEAFKSAFPTIVMRIIGKYYAGDSGLLRVYEAGALIYFTIEAEGFQPASQLFGRSFGTTWNSRKTAANMVESAPEIIESILREELGAVTADINETLFDAADTARALPAAGQLHEVRNSMDVVKDICDEYGLLYYVDILGKHSLVNLDWRPVTKHLFLHDWYKPFDNVKISYTPRAEIVNDIILHYDRNQFTGEYRKVAFCNKDTASGAIDAAYIAKCAASYAELGNAVQALEINADWIKDTATAEAMVCWTIDWLYKQRIIITGDLFLDSLDLTFGDVVDVDIEPLLPKSFTSTARFMAMSVTISRTNSRLSVKLLEVKEP